MGSTSGRPGASRHRRGGDGAGVRTSLVGGDWRGEYEQDAQPGLSALLHRDDVARRRRRRGRAGTRGRLGGVPVVAMIAIVASVVVVAAAIGVSRVLTASPAANNAAAPNPNCTLIVPADPLTAAGLATPYQLTATNPADGPCNEANGAQTAFVQGAVLDPATGQISVYNPLVVDAGTQPAVAPVTPVLPANAVVALWFGYNGTTLSLAGADQQLPGTASPSAPSSGGTTSSASPSASSSASPSTSSSPSGTASGSTSGTASSSATASPSGSSSPSGSTSPSTASSSGATPASSGAASATATPSGTGTASAAAAATGTAAASVQDVAAAPLPPAGDQANTWFGATLTSATGTATHHHPSPSPSGSASGTPSVTASPSASGTAAASGTPTATASAPPVSPGDTPAASGTPDAILQQANCVAGEDFGGTFSSFTQVGACNAVAFFAAANAAIKAGMLKVPAPGTGKDGNACPTTRSFTLIDQDQSDNVTSEYLATGNGQTAQDTAANRQAMGGGAGILFNGSDNGLLDFFIDPALGCTPWQVPNLADGGAPATALPLDELQATAFAGTRGQTPALVPLNDPMTLDPNGNYSTDKTNTYRSLMDMPPLPAGESPHSYCIDMEYKQGKRLQQDVNLLLAAPSPAPAAADNLFTFMAMRLQQSFVNLNCGSFGNHNDVSVTADGNGVVVAACFVHQFAPATPGSGNPMAGHTTCPATITDNGTPGGAASPSSTPTPNPSYGYQDRPSTQHSTSHHM